jgi:hypothetical protein
MKLIIFMLLLHFINWNSISFSKTFQFVTKYGVDSVEIIAEIPDYHPISTVNSMDLKLHLINNSSSIVYIPFDPNQGDSVSILYNDNLVLNYGGSIWYENSIDMKLTNLRIKPHDSTIYQYSINFGGINNSLGSGCYNILFSYGQYILTHSLIVIDFAVFIDKDGKFEKYSNQEFSILDSQDQRYFSFSLNRCQLIIPVYINPKN